MEPSDPTQPPEKFPSDLRIVQALHLAIAKGTWDQRFAEMMDAAPKEQWPAEVWKALDLQPEQ